MWAIVFDYRLLALAAKSSGFAPCKIPSLVVSALPEGPCLWGALRVTSLPQQYLGDMLDCQLLGSVTFVMHAFALKFFAERVC